MTNNTNLTHAKVRPLAFLAALLFVPIQPALADGIALRPEVRQFVDDMVTRNNFNRDELIMLLSQAETRPEIIAAITKPAEAKPWFQYRQIFLNEARIRGGVEFWDKHTDLLARAQSAYGVPPEIITAIIGVETGYGKRTGSYRVLDALSTLGFDYPPRSKFFLGELENFLLMAREEKLDPLVPQGSYAGAMGMPQFMPSSFRRYAVDFDADGSRDLWNNVADVIGSVGYYFFANGWQPDQPVASRAKVDGENFKAVLTGNIKPSISLGKLKENGVTIEDTLADDQPGALLEFQTETGPEYWVGLQNFYAITRYNRSPLYAMAVYQLSQEIRALRKARRVSDNSASPLTANAKD